MYLSVAFVLLLVVGILLLGVYASDEDDDDGPHRVIDSGAAMQQYKHWKTQASTYSEMEEIDEMIDDAHRRLRKERGDPLPEAPTDS